MRFKGKRKSILLAYVREGGEWESCGIEASLRRSSAKRRGGYDRAEIGGNSRRGNGSVAFLSTQPKGMIEDYVQRKRKGRKER